MDWIDQAEDRNQWRALVSMVMNLRVPHERLHKWWLLKKNSVP
jgi:hypothetical protein